MAQMSARPPRSIIATLGAVLAAGLLAGCSTQSAQPQGSLGGAASAGPGPTSAAAVATPTVGASLPADFTVNFDLVLSGSQTQVQLLTQAKALILAYEQAIERNNPKDPLYQSMVTGLAATNLAASITTYQAAQQRPTGTLEFYQFSTDVTAIAADVLFCENRSQVNLVNFKTGAPMTNDDNGKQHWDIGFNHKSDGTWVIAYVSALTVTAGSTQCT
jgi:hypothetical protein